MLRLTGGLDTADRVIPLATRVDPVSQDPRSIGAKPKQGYLTTMNKQESVMVDTRIFTIYQIVILEYWRQLITS